MKKLYFLYFIYIIINTDKETKLKQKIILYYNLNVDLDDFSFNQKINNQNIIFKYIVDNAKN